MNKALENQDQATTDSPRSVFQTQRRVEFRDTDAAGIVHFSAFFPIMESVEHEFLRSVGIAVMPPHDDPHGLTWPRVSATCDYYGPVRFEDLLDIAVHIDRVGQSSVAYRYEISCGGTRVATGRIVAVCCRLAAGGRLTKSPVPPDVRERLESPEV